MSTSASATTTNAAAAAAPANGRAVATLPAEVRCSYPSKLCNNHRAVKDNGDLHKLCDFHRKKANVNQQRMQQKRRLIRQQMIERKKRFMDAGVQPQPGMMFAGDAAATAAAAGMFDGRPICNLTHEEVMMLEVMLFDDEDDEAFLAAGDGAIRFPNMPATAAVDSASFLDSPANNMTL